jgi:nicotinate-nucleotide adenylyltransferase
LAHVGLLGGTFNPPHIGHLVCAQQALEALGLDVVRLVPTHTPPHKVASSDPGVEVRLELCRLAVEGEPRLEVSRLEADRPGPSYTVDSLRALHAEAPADELTFIVGGDMARSLPGWREPEAVLELAWLGVAERDGVRREEILDALADLPGAPDRVRFFDMPRLDISSSMLRGRAAEGKTLRHLVPERVRAVIEERGLYRVGDTAWAR